MPTEPTVDSGIATLAAELDAADPLAGYHERFLPGEPDDVVSYLDGNSLGRPLRASAARIDAFVRSAWAGRLIRGWDEEWFDLPVVVGDRIGQVVLGAGRGQVVVADSTTVLLYKLARGGVALRPDRSEIVADTDNFPTDRYVVEAVAEERGLTLRWIESDPSAGVEPAQLADALCDRTALVLLSHVAYRSGHIADAETLTAMIHDAGAIVLWDLSHSAGSVPIELDAWRVDLAVGCTYKYLNGGPGSPAYAYVRADLQDSFAQPIWGWMGRADPFGMAAGYRPAAGIRSVISGTPPIVGMMAMQDMLDLIDEVGIAAVRAKSVLLTGFAGRIATEWLVPYGARISSPTAAFKRGGHLTIDHPAFSEVLAGLWSAGVIPDFRAPMGLRLGLSPLSTSFAEVASGMRVIRDRLADAVGTL